MTMDIIDVNGAADMLGISREQFYRLLKEDQMIPHFRVGKRLRFVRESLIEYFQQKSSNQQVNGGANGQEEASISKSKV